MALKGGYQMIDLQGTAFTLGNAQTISGIYEKLEGGYSKPILLTGLNIRNVEKRDAWCNFSVEGTTFVASFDDYTVEVTDDDEVTFTARSYYLDDIVDENGNQRFISGNATKPSALTKVDLVFGKWNLSGSHLMIVGAFKVNEAVDLAGGQELLRFTVPDFIKDKIKVINESASIVMAVSGVRVRVEGANWTVANIPSQLRYSGGNTYQVILTATTTSLLADDGIRIEYDLLID